MRLSRMMLAVAIAATLFVAGAWAQGQQTQDQQVKAYIDMMRKDIRAQKQSLVDQAMGLEAGDKAKFWAVYQNYQNETKALWDQRLVNIKKYADNFNNNQITDAVADELIAKAIEIDTQRAAIRKKYYAQMKAALGARVAARFLQTEVMLDHLIELQLGSEIPLMP